MYLQIMMYLDYNASEVTAKFICPNVSSILREDDKLRKAEAVAQFCLLCLWVLELDRHQTKLMFHHMSKVQREIFALILYGNVVSPSLKLEPPDFVNHDDRQVSLHSV
jgi:hypothetical protein